MILDTIARSAGKRVEQRKQVKPLEQVMKEAFKCRETYTYRSGPFGMQRERRY